VAIGVWNMLERSGGIDWAGLPLIVGLLGITDIDGLMIRLQAIKAYTRKEK
jgi:hypothetical protein